MSARSDASGHHVDALITLADIDALAEAGYALLVAGITDRRDPSTHKPEFIGFEEWHKEMLGDLERQHKEL